MNKNKILFILRSSKTRCEADKLQSIKISAKSKGPMLTPSNRNRSAPGIFCPFGLLRSYLKIRPKYISETEPFFVFRDRTPVSIQLITKIFKSSLINGGFDPMNYSFHTLRAGRAVDLLSYGVSVETIKDWGRWKSNAVFCYLR